MSYFALGWLGFGAGAYGSMIGAGGGFILVPLLLLFFHLEPETAVGTSLMLVFLNAISGTASYLRQRRIDLRTGLIIAAAALPGSVLGAFAIRWVSSDLFSFLFGLLMLAVASWVLLRPEVKHNKPRGHPSGRSRRLVTSGGAVYDYTVSEGMLTAASVGQGFISSFFGIGGGIIGTPLLIYVFAVPVAVATATSLFSFSFYTGVGALTHLALGNISWSTAVAAGIGIVIGAQVGARLSSRVSSVWLLRLLALGLLAVSGRMLAGGVDFFA